MSYKNISVIYIFIFSYRWVNGKICDVDPFTEDYYEDPAKCQKPIPDRVNNVHIYVHMLR